MQAPAVATGMSRRGTLWALVFSLAVLLLVLLLPAGAALAGAKPGKPVAKAPTGSITTSVPTFSWGKARGATRYELRVSQGAKVVLKKTGITKLSYKATKGLATGVGLTWKVRGVNAAGAGAWSAALAFKVAALSSAKAITSFTFDAEGVTGVILEPMHTISAAMPYGTAASALTSLTPTIVHSGASVSPASGAPRDFSSPVTYTVTAATTTTTTAVDSSSTTLPGASTTVATGATSTTIAAAEPATAVQAQPTFTG